MVKTERERRGAPVIGIEGFANPRGVVKGLESFRNRKAKKRLQTAKALRQYAKVMKQEGLEAGRGISRRRHDGEAPSSDHPNMAKKKKSNPFDKAANVAEQRLAEKAQRELERAKGEERKVRKLRERQERKKLLSKKTKKGQPIMKNVVHDILRKLDK